MTRKMIVNAVDPEDVRIAILNDARLEEFDIETRGVEKNKGNIYKARVVDVEPSLNAAFVDYGADKQGFLTAGDVDPLLSPSKPADSGRNPTIADLLKPKQELLVQVTKDEVGSKGAVLTTYLSLAGRYVVLQPDSNVQGVSRKIDDEETRRSMREAVAKLEVPDGMGVILRTAGRDRSKLELMRDLKVLLRLWDNIKRQQASAKAPALIFKEQDVIIRALRDYFSTDMDEVVLDSDEAFDRAAEYMDMVMPKYRHALTRYVERRPIFHHYRIEEQLEALYSPRVPLYSGGSLVIERTEALVAIDVNSGKQKHGDHEETATRTNLEAAREVARQLRLRDLGGIVVVDFIDMMSRKNQQKVERMLREAVKDDKARIKIGRISRNGTLELTRQRIRREVAASVFRTCTVCHGTGRILNPESHAVSVLRKLRDRAARGDLLVATARVEPEAANHLRTVSWAALQEMEQRYGVRIEVQPDHSLSPGQDDFTFETDPNAVVNEIAEPNFGPAPLPADLALAVEEAEAAEEEEEEEEVAATGTDGEGHGRSRRRRRRRRKPGGQGALGKSGDLQLPSFELVDPRELGLGRSADRANGNGHGHHAARDGGAAHDDAAPRRRRRRRRRSSAAGGAPGTRPQARREAGSKGRASASAMQHSKAAEAKKKPGFFARLFGLGKGG